eukprot:GEMP01110942.1.p1 GENE.GEMP01110942.1~~GEMP01110942.1.p1  ORF type:complete len:123 (+),score=8.88 GEMP01110942.1:71-439(+)
MEEFRDEMLETPEQESRPMAFRSLHYMQRLMLRRREITKTGPRPRPRELQNTRHFAGRMLVRVKQLRSRPRLASSEISFGGKNTEQYLLSVGLSPLLIKGYVRPILEGYRTEKTLKTGNKKY